METQLQEFDNLCIQKIFKVNHSTTTRSFFQPKIRGGLGIYRKPSISKPVTVFRATIGICDWSKEELAELDIRTGKPRTMNGSLHPRSDTDRLYIP